MNIKLLAEHHLEFLSLKGSCTCSSESINVKMPQRWKSHVTAQNFMKFDFLPLEKEAMDKDQRPSTRTNTLLETLNCLSFIMQSYK